MTSLTLHATGRAPVERAWGRYFDTRLWSSWSPQIRRVQLDDDGDHGQQLRTGLTGRVIGPAGVSVRFEIDAVDAAARTWSWRVHAGPISLRLLHAVRTAEDGSATTLTIRGPAPVVLAYCPVAQLALRQLVRPDPGVRP